MRGHRVGGAGAIKAEASVSCAQNNKPAFVRPVLMIRRHDRAGRKKKENKRMKQLVQNLKVLRAMSGRFLTVAVVAAALTFTNSAKADPGQGAVVTFTERDGTELLTTYSTDGELMLQLVYGNPGDFVRLNPDGTLSISGTATQAPMTVSVRVSEDEYVPAWIGIGSFHSTDLVEPDPDPNYNYMSTGEARYWHIQGQLVSLLDGSQWSLHVVVVERHQEYKVLAVDFQPMGG